MNDILKKPVHPVVYNYTELEKLSHSKELLKTSVSLEQYRRADMPIEIKQPRSLIKHKDVKLSTLQKTRARVKLKVIYDSPKLKLPKEAIPDCKNCKTQACCVAFIVHTCVSTAGKGTIIINSTSIIPKIRTCSTYTTF